jgi:UDP-GlcNAc:undecaprenyl-phosphate GlcNAc-1-phosphate transferase
MNETAWLGLVFAFLLALALTPFVKKFAILVGATDKPNHRKVHNRIMPRLGGLAIFLAFSIVAIYMLMADWLPADQTVIGFLIGGAIIVLVGALDDRFELSPKWKVLGQLIAAAVVVSFGIKIDIVAVPFTESYIDIGWLSIPITMFWIVAITNAVNLIDGLDGLAAGVSAIAITTIMILSIIMGNVIVFTLCAILLGAIIGFLFFNFYPAKIFMGDTGALFLGFMLASLSILGYKQAAFVSFVIPFIILGVPLSDTLFAIIRRRLNKQPISVADKSHLHHCLLRLGLSHRNTVLVIYAIAAFFGVCAIILSQATLWFTVTLFAVMLLLIEVGAESIGILSRRKKPLIYFFHRVRLNTKRFLAARYRVTK